MDLINRFETHIHQKNLFHKEDLLIITISGGVDSIVLAQLCLQLKYNIIIAHCNFQLRGEESDREEQFVADFAKTNNVPFHIHCFETEKESIARKLSIQETARVLRYEWFHQLANQYTQETKGKVYILTAHHADDQIETLLMHFFRGTGLKGLTGIPEKNGIVIRPLLPFFKSEILEYAKAHSLPYVEDSSNLSSKYTRNFFRNELIPLLEQVYPTVRENLLDNIRRFTAIESHYNPMVQTLINRITIKRGKETYISIRALKKYHNEAFLYELIRPWGFTEAQLPELLKMMEASSGSVMLAPHTGNRIIRHRNHLIIASPAEQADDLIIIQKGCDSIAYTEGNLSFQSLEWQADRMEKNNSIALLDTENLTYPLILRKWKEGDYFYPLGMPKKKKIARFLIDEKLSRTDKERLWVLESQSRIVWVVGHRIDDRFKINANTHTVLRIERRG